VLYKLTQRRLKVQKEEKFYFHRRINGLHCLPEGTAEKKKNSPARRNSRIEEFTGSRDWHLRHSEKDTCAEVKKASSPLRCETANLGASHTWR